MGLGITIARSTHPFMRSASVSIAPLLPSAHHARSPKLLDVVVGVAKLLEEGDGVLAERWGRCSCAHVGLGHTDGKVGSFYRPNDGVVELEHQLLGPDVGV